MSNLAPIQVYAEVAWTIDPLVRPAEDDWERIAGLVPVYLTWDGDPLTWDGDLLTWGSEIDPTIGGLRNLSTKRGTNVRTGRVDPSRATAKFDNKLRQLDPRNLSSPWYPNVRARRRIRFVVEPEGETARTIATGFIKRLPSPWIVGDSWVDLETEDLLDLVAEEDLPPSVIHIETLAAGPLHYWPLTETSGRRAVDLVGTLDLTYLNEPKPNDTLLPYDNRRVQTWSIPSVQGLIQQTATTTYTGTAAFTAAIWFQMTQRAIGSAIATFQVFTLVDGFGAGFGIGIDRLTAAGDGRVLGILSEYDGGYVDAHAFNDTFDVFDGEPHLLVLGYDRDAEEGYISVDGMTEPLVAASGWPDPETVIAGKLSVGYEHAGFSPSLFLEEPQSWLAGHAALFDRMLTADEIAVLLDAGMNAWSGDRTGERLTRILDLLGIDDDDRDVEVGTQVCGPAILGGNGRAYIEKIGATEQGPILVNATGKILFRGRTPNDPTVVATFTGNHVDDPGTPYLAITPDDGIDRLINRVDVTLENGTTVITEDLALRASWGPKRESLATLHLTASGARATGSRLIIRNGQPRMIITALRVAGHDTALVSPEAWLDLEVGDAVNVICQPTGGETFTVLAIIEWIAYRAEISGDRVLTMGLFEHIVLPCFSWGTPGQGWAESVWCEGA